ncbi:hypothetical protein OB919_09585 [Halobacteria archaeon AArc-curdl1]|uniref:Uncharacterized protein n=1 Tax=Natronosalvus hydrolyticus TaxID=2979988 RepID=A0AAP2Z7P4_9EURY|nr:hypothetical protein [Halobacteria archaeon AArc-curdl1]
MAELVSSEFAESLVSTSRVTVGDTLRSVIYFTPEDFEVLYVRSDLYGGDEDLMHEAKSTLVESERVGFQDIERYNKQSQTGSTAEPTVGEYEFTVRVFSEGFISRVIVGDCGVIVTSDEIEIGPFEDMSVAIRKMLAEPHV